MTAETGSYLLTTCSMNQQMLITRRIPMFLRMTLRGRIINLPPICPNVSIHRHIVKVRSRALHHPTTYPRTPATGAVVLGQHMTNYPENAP